jgi:hypothetical protein
MPSVVRAAERADPAELDHVSPLLASPAVPVLVGPFHAQSTAGLADGGAFQILDAFASG